MPSLRQDAGGAAKGPSNGLRRADRLQLLQLYIMMDRAEKARQEWKNKRAKERDQLAGSCPPGREG